LTHTSILRTFGNLLLQVIVVAFGALFTLLTSVLVFLDYRFGGSSHTSEQFSTAGEWLACVGQHLESLHCLIILPRLASPSIPHDASSHSHSKQDQRIRLYTAKRQDLGSCQQHACGQI
jgi:hypothetical protein